MYNAKYIIPGLVVFVGIFTLPIWLNLCSPKYVYPEVALPQGQVTLYGGSEPVVVDAGAACVEPRDWMRANHMSLLLDWRDEALRDEKRVYVASNGKEWNLHGLPRQQGRVLRQMPRSKQRESVLLGLPRHTPGEQS